MRAVVRRRSRGAHGVTRPTRATTNVPGAGELAGLRTRLANAEATLRAIGDMPAGRVARLLVALEEQAVAAVKNEAGVFEPVAPTAPEVVTP